MRTRGSLVVATTAIGRTTTPDRVRRAIVAAKSAFCWPVVGFLAAALVSFTAVDLCGQNPTVGPPSASVFPPAPRALRQNLVRAKKAIDEERFSDAVAELGSLLGGAPEAEAPGTDTQDFFIDSPAGNGTLTSLKAEAQTLLGSLPPKGKELFELRYGADARGLLEESVRRGDINQLNEVVRKFFHTQAGYEAAILLGRLHLDHGRPLAGALCLQRVAKVTNVAARYEPELSLLLAACWKQAGQDAAAEAALASVVRQVQRGELRIGEETIRQLPASGMLREWLQTRFRAAPEATAHLDQWPLFRGNPARTGTPSGGMPLRRARWEVSMVMDEHDKGLVHEIQGSFQEQGWPVLPVIHPLAVGDVIVMRSAECLMGVDFRTGKQIWSYPWWDASQLEETRPSTPLTAPENRRERRANDLRERLWQDAAFGQVSSDGQTVYLLEGQRQPAELLQGMRWNRMRGIGGMPVESASLQNELVALDLQREGYLLWKVGGETGGEEPLLAGALFLGPPLPLFGQLHAIAELKGELRLVVLDASTGRQVWSQQLAHLDTSWGADEQLRHLSGATPSFADGVLVCPTSAGALVAVDLATRTLLWGHQYLVTKDSFGRNGFMQPFAMQQPANPNRWQDASVTIADGMVLATPVDEETLICLDLLTGQPKWKPLPRNGELSDMLYVGGIHQGTAIVVGKTRVVGVKLADGAVAWNIPLRGPNSEMESPSGRGFVTGSEFLLPTTGSSLLRIDLITGKVTERVPTDYPLGNLICFRDEVISVAADRAATFYQLAPLRTAVQERLRTNDADAWALARLGELLVQDGKTNEALTTLRRARQLNPQDDGVNSLLVETFLSALSLDYGAHQALSAEMEPLIAKDDLRTRYYLIRALGEHQRGNLVSAADGYAELARRVWEQMSRIPTEDAFGMLTPMPGLSVRADRFLGARFADIAGSNDSAARERVEKFVGEMAGRLRPESRPDLRHFLQLFGLHPAAHEWRLRLGDLLVRDGEWLAAEQNLMPLASAGSTPASGAAWALLSEVYSNGRSPRMLEVCRERLTRHWADVSLWEGKTGKQWSDLAGEPSLLGPSTNGLRTGIADWAWGAVHISETRDIARQSLPSQPCLPVLERRGEALEGLRIVFDYSRSSTYLRDGNGLPAFRLPHIEARLDIDSGLWRTAADGHYFFSAMSGQLVAIDTLRVRPNEPETVLWRDSLLPSTSAEGPKAADRILHCPLDSSPLVFKRWVDASGRGVANIGPLTAEGVCFQKIRTVSCVDPRTGQVLWNRTDLEAGSELFGDQEFVFVVPPASQAGAAAGQRDPVDCTMVRVRDGQILGKRPLPPADRRWGTRGRHLLAWETKENASRLFLYDVAAAKDLWSEPFTEGSRGCLVENEWVAVVQPDGQYFLRSLAAPELRFQGKIEPITGLASVQLLVSHHQFLLIVNDNQTLGSEMPEIWRRPNRQAPINVNGRIYALSRSSGDPLWQVPALVRGFSLLPEQPADVPVMWLVGSRQPNGPTATPPRLDVLCLDRRTGAVLLLKNDVANPVNNFDVSADPRKQEVVLSLQQVQLTARLTDEPRPPAPPAQLNRESNRVDSALERFGDFMESVKDALK